VASGVSGYAVFCRSSDEWGAVIPIVIGFLYSCLRVNCAVNRTWRDREEVRDE
jgi:hypothetical protein